MDEARKRVLGIMAAILAARKLAQYDSGTRVPATISAIGDAIRWAEHRKHGPPAPPRIFGRFRTPRRLGDPSEKRQLECSLRAGNFHPA